MLNNRSCSITVVIIGALLIFLFMIGCGMATSQEKPKDVPAAKENAPIENNTTASAYPKDALHKAACNGNIEEVSFSGSLIMCYSSFYHVPEIV